MTHFKSIFITLFLGLFLACSITVHAAPPDPAPAAPATATPPDNSLLGWAKSSVMKAMGINFDTSVSISAELSKLSGVKEVVATVVDNADPFGQARETAKKLTEGATSPALVLLAVLSIIVVAWAGLQMIAGEDMMGELTDAVITVAFFSMLVTQYDQMFGQYLPKFFTTWGDAIYQATSGQTATTATVGGVAGAFVETLFTIIMKALTATVENIVSYFFMFTAIFLLFSGPAIYKIATAAVSVVAIFMISNGVAAIALALGPVAVALGVLPWTRKIFYAWIAVITAALGIKVIGAAALPVLTFFSDQMAQSGNFSGNQSGIGVGGFFGAGAIKDVILLMIYAEVLSSLVGMIPELAHAIFGGVMGQAMGRGKGGGGFQAATATAGKMATSAANTKAGAIKIGMKILSKGAV